MLSFKLPIAHVGEVSLDRGGRTHLVSPMMAAAAAIKGHFTDVRDWKFK